jgi:predicted cupin superfamily sugar epimerase
MHWSQWMALPLLFTSQAMATPTKDRNACAHSAQEVIDKLNLVPNVEKGWFVETYRDGATNEKHRSVSTAIYYLLEGSVGFSAWHRVDATEIWHYYAGAPLKLELAYENSTIDAKVLGSDIFDNQHPQVVIEKKVWQRAISLGEWTLVGTTVAPGFVEEGFELAPPDWSPVE